MTQVLYWTIAMPLLTATAITLGGSKQAVKTISLAGSAILTSLIFSLVYETYSAGSIQAGIFYVDQLSCLLLVVIGILSFTTTLFSVSYMDHELEGDTNELRVLKRYYVMLNVFCFTMLSVLVVENLGLMWVAIEATTLASALLVAFYFSRSAIEAAWKYVMVCTVGICLALLGTILLYYAQVNVGPEGGEALSWLALRGIGERLDPGMTKLAFVFILIGYGTKVGLAPMHTWLPDAHSQAPSPVSGLLSGALLSCALYAIMRNIAVVKGAVGFDFIQQLLIAFGLLSISIAIPFLLVQHDVKRLLAYSSVEHMGIITLALGIGTPLAVYGALLHIFNHAIAKSGLFFIAGLITQQYRTKHILRIRGIISVIPYLGTGFILFALTITGTPPFGVFFSKFIITWAVFDGGFNVVGVILLLLLAAVFAGMIYYCFQMLFTTQNGCPKKMAIGIPAKVAMGLSALIIIISGFYLPEYFNSALHQAAAIVIGG